MLFVLSFQKKCLFEIYHHPVSVIVSLLQRYNIDSYHKYTFRFSIILLDYFFIFIFRGVSINFLAERPRIGVPSPNILFHFNPRPANRLILNSCVNGRWQQEHQVTGNDLDGMLLQTPFDLKIQILTVGDTESEFEVYINDVFLTTFRSPFPITNTMFIGFSPSIRITMPIIA